MSEISRHGSLFEASDPVPTPPASFILAKRECRPSPERTLVSGAEGIEPQSAMRAGRLAFRNRVLTPCLKETAGIKFDGYNHRRERTMLRKIMFAAFVVAFAGGTALAQETCESKAVGKDGKPLAGAAKTSFVKKCMADTCATKAVSQDGKPLSGAAKTSFMKKCEKGA
jgi:hypothetical protein